MWYHWTQIGRKPTTKPRQLHFRMVARIAKARIKATRLWVKLSITTAITSFA